MKDEHTQTLSSFYDGEIVDPEALREALAYADGRDALVDFARLRAGVTVTAPLPDSLSRLRTQPPAAGRRVPSWAAIAALLLLAVVTLTLLPRFWTMKPASDAPPTPTRVVRYVPGVDWHPEPR